MQRKAIAIASAAALLVAGAPAHACITYVPINLHDISRADVVVLGYIANYRIVRDQKARLDRRRMLASQPDMPTELRKSYANQTEYLSDYASFDIKVDKVLVGTARKNISVTWQNSTFAEPKTMPPGPYLIALRGAGSRLPPFRGPSATILPDPKTRALTILQAPCSRAFIFESAGSQAAQARQILSGK